MVCLPSIRRFALLAVLGAVCAQGAAAEPLKTIAGPVEARIVTVYDGDTFVAEAFIWPSQSVRIRVRIRGIDAPEKRSRCALERRQAERSRRLLAALLTGRTVRIRNIAGGKYYGRVLADVETDAIRDVAALMIARDQARPYRGGRRTPFCRASGSAG